MKKLKLKIDNKLVMLAALAFIIVEQAPNLLNDYLFKDNPLTGIKATIGGVAAGVAAGMLMKKPVMTSVAVAVGVGEIANGFVGKLLLGDSVRDFVSIDAEGKPSFALSDYTNSPEIMATSEYQDAYSQLN